MAIKRGDTNYIVLVVYIVEKTQNFFLMRIRKNTKLITFFWCSGTTARATGTAQPRLHGPGQAHGRLSSQRRGSRSPIKPTPCLYCKS